MKGPLSGVLVAVVCLGLVACSQGESEAKTVPGPSVSTVAPVRALDADLSDGTATIGQVNGGQPLPAAPVTARGSAPFPYEAALKSYLATRSGRVSVGVFDATTGATYSYNGDTQHMTASIVKVAILETLLRQAQDENRSLTSTDRSLANRMIKQSDNAATDVLWRKAGRGPAIRRYIEKVGMSSTIMDSDGYWGLTSTTAPDQVRLVRTVAYPSQVLTEESSEYQESLMREVTPSQKWGVSGGVPATATVALKNGWLPRTKGWVINSVGHIRGGTHDYVISVLTSDNPSMSYGVSTIEHVSGLVWLAAPVAPAAPAAGAFGDFNADGRPDLMARQASTGYIYLYPSNKTHFTEGKPLAVDWTGMASITRIGDLDGDGREDVIARESATGALWLYLQSSTGFASPRKIGQSGWNNMREITPVGDLNGDGHPDLLAVQAKTGSLFLYPGTGTSLGAGRLLTGGWNVMSELAGAGDFDRDGHVDLVALNRVTSDLWLYPGTGKGLGPGVRIARGWQGERDLVGVGDFDGDGFNDLVAVQTATGKLFLYPGHGKSLGASVLVGSNSATDFRLLL
jgi:beta-lactamase class A